MATKWKKVETGGGKMDQYWPGKAADRKEGMFVEGTYEKKQPTRRPDGTEDHLYVLRTEDGKSVGVNSAAGLDRAMEQVQTGSLIRITFLGKQMGSNGRQFNNFQVDVAETAEDSSNETETLEQAPF